MCSLARKGVWSLHQLEKLVLYCWWIAFLVVLHCLARMACSLRSQRAKSRSPRRRETHVLIPALRQSNTQEGSWSLEKVQVPSPQWQAFMRGSWHSATNTKQEAQIETDEDITSNIETLVDAIAELSKEAVELLHTVDPRGELCLSSAGPSHMSAPCLKGILHGVEAVEKCGNDP